jgi:hypothetical protein
MAINTNRPNSSWRALIEGVKELRIVDLYRTLLNF